MCSLCNRLTSKRSTLGSCNFFPLAERSATYTDSDGNAVSEMNSRYGDTCHGHGGSDVFPFGLLETDVDGFEVGDPCIGIISTCGKSVLHPRRLRIEEP